MNVLCLGSEVVGAELASELIRAFLTARFDGGERYVRRLKKVEAMEREMHHGEVTTARAERARGQRLDRLDLARVARGRLPREADARGRRRRRHLEPDDLPEGDVASGDRYDEQLREVAAAAWTTRPRSSSRSRPRTSRTRCDVLRPVWDEGWGQDGYVSLEVDPTLAYDRERTFEQAMRLHEEVDRPNLFVKIPATEPGLGAIEDAIARGKSINVTLIFSLDRYRAVVEAYIRGLERLVEARRRPVARRLGGELLRLARRHRGGQAARGDRQRRAPGEARDREREARLPALPRGVPRRALGARSPRQARRSSAASGRRRRRRIPPTATCMYVEELIGPETVNTMPLETIEAFQDHGEVRGDTLLEGVDEAKQLFDELRARRRRLRRRDRHARARGRAEVRGLVRGAARRDPREAGRARRGLSGARPSGSGPATPRSGPARTRTAGSAGWTSSPACGRGSTS